MNYGDIKPLSGVALEIRVNGVVAINLDKMAQARGMTRARFVQQLFDAAYSARCAPTGDDDLDAAVTGEHTGGDTKASGKIKALQQSNAALREQIAALKNAAVSPAADTSGEVLELRRKLLDAEQARAASERALEAKIEALNIEVIAAAQARTDEASGLRKTINGLTAENNRLRQAARVAADLAAVPAEIGEVGRAIPSAEADTGQAAAPEPPPQDVMTRHNIKTAKGYQAAGWDDASIATEMGLTIANVRALRSAKVK